MPLERFGLGDVLDAAVGDRRSAAALEALKRDGAIVVDLGEVPGIQLHFDTACELARLTVRPRHRGYVDRAVLPAPCQQQLALLGHTEVVSSVLYNVCTQIALALTTALFPGHPAVKATPVAFRYDSAHCPKERPGLWTHTDWSVLAVTWQSGPGIKGIVRRDGHNYVAKPPADKQSVVVWLGEAARKLAADATSFRHCIKRQPTDALGIAGERLSGAVYVDPHTDAGADVLTLMNRAHIKQAEVETAAADGMESE